MLKQSVRLATLLMPVFLVSSAACAEVIREAFAGRDGSLELVFYIKGKKIARQVWDTDGNHLSTTGIIPNGVVKHHYTDGTVWEVPYKNNLAEGDAKIYDKRGTLKVKSHYTRGKLDGISRIYDTGGHLIGELHYREGSLLEKKE